MGVPGPRNLGMGGQQEAGIARLGTALLVKHLSSVLGMMSILSHERKDGGEGKGKVLLSRARKGNVTTASLEITGKQRA